jgi:hypothetical protein
MRPEPFDQLGKSRGEPSTSSLIKDNQRSCGALVAGLSW